MKKQIIYSLVIMFTLTFVGCSEDQAYLSWKKKGEEFLKKNAKQEGIQTTSTGLQYKIIHPPPVRQGSPKSGDYVRVKYTRSTFADNDKKKSVSEDDLEELDSYLTEEGKTMSVSSFLAGERDGLTRMTLDSKWRIYIPYSLAYGKDGSKNSDKKHDYRVKPYSVIIFEVEILAIN